jgi:plastocyanin domain-containing protein
MSNPQIFVILSGIVMTILIAWYFWFAPKTQTRVAVSASGAQEVAITVKGGYTPDVIVVQKGRPVRLTFTRQESSACSEMVLFPDFNHKLGEFGFQCQMGMLRGKLIVEG